MLWRTCFFIIVVHGCTKSLRHTVSRVSGIRKKLFTRISNSLALNYYAFMFTCDFYRYEHIILQKEGISKHSGKQGNFATSQDSCYLFNFEHETEHEIDRTYGVYMHLTFPNFATNKFDSLVVCNIIPFFFNCLRRGKFHTQPLWPQPEYWEELN